MHRSPRSPEASSRRSTGPPDVELDYERDLGWPGEYPFTRGVHASMYRGRLWTMRQFAGFGTARETNERFKFLLEHGQTGLSVAFDFPTLMGYDSDDPIAAGARSGRSGVAVASLRDMQTLMAGIPMDQVSTSMTINGPAPILLAFYIACGESAGRRPEAAARHGPERHPEGIPGAARVARRRPSRRCG